MDTIELIGGPLDGALAETGGVLDEGDYITVESDGGPNAIYRFRDGLLEFDPVRTFGREA